ncbi:hypothetical protein ABT389_10345 [Streptomyces bacillaris]
MEVERKHAHAEAVQHTSQILLYDGARRRARTVAHIGSLSRNAAPQTPV